jgi:TolB protein
MAQAKDGRGRHLVTTAMHQPALSPDGEWLALNGERPDHVNLFVVKPDGSSLMEITPYAEDGQPGWSPDGKKLVIASFRHGDKQPRIYFLDDIPFGGGRVEGRALRHSTDDVRGQMPSWTSDGRIVFQGCDLSSPREGCNGLGLFVAPIAPGAHTPTRLTEHPGDSSPAVAGGRVIFMSNRDGDWELYAMGLDGSEVLQLTRDDKQDGLPVWSPDGKMLAFVSNRDGTWAVWAMAPDGSGQRRLFEVGGGGLQSDWTQERIGWGP